jgi:hypothetical protein
MTSAYQAEYVPAIREIHDAFVDEVASQGGVVSNVFGDDVRLFARSVLPAQADVRAGDAVNAGIALRASGAEIVVSPYTFRQVCRNGAIAAHVMQSRRLERVECGDVLRPADDGAVTLLDVRAAVRACAASEVFTSVVDELRTATDVQIEAMIQLLPVMRRLPRGDVAEIVDRFMRARDWTAFGLMNAVTSYARDTRDAEHRWNLEELGGTLVARLVKPSPRVPEASLARV